MSKHTPLLIALCVAGLWACLPASNAAAMTMYECKENPEGPGPHYSDSSCTQFNGSGKYETVTLEQGKTVEVTPTSTETFLSQVVLLGIPFKFHCENATGSAQTTNSVDEKGNMYVQGNGKVKLQQCIELEPEGVGCTIPTEIETKELQLQTAGMSTSYVPKEGTTLTTLKISGCGGSAKGLNGEWAVTGKLVAVTEEATPTTQRFTSTSGSEMKIGGTAATFTGALHYATKANGQTLALETP
jgi:hypothetical protein